MRVLVTGGAGFIGRKIVHQLRDRGDEVVAVIRNPEQIGALSGLAVRLGTMQLDMAEAVRSGLGVTYWASHAKATSELGWVPRSLSEGVVDAFGGR